MSRDTSRKEAAGIVLFFVAIAIILIFYLPVSLTGMLGAVVKNFFFGLVGVAAYAIPVYILYVALDVFFEKRQGVSGIRVRSVILLLVSVSALLALCSMDMAYFEGLSQTPEGKKSAFKALSLLWESGSNQEIICNPVNSAPVLTGGIVGGAIAVSLFEVTGKGIGILTIVVFLLTQIRENTGLRAASLESLEGAVQRLVFLDSDFHFVIPPSAFCKEKFVTLELYLISRRLSRAFLKIIRIFLNLRRVRLCMGEGEKLFVGRYAGFPFPVDHLGGNPDADFGECQPKHIAILLNFSCNPVQ